MMFSVLHWGSHPDLNNDDCFTGEDFDSLDKAIAAFKIDAKDYSVEYIEIDGVQDSELAKLGLSRIRKNGNFNSRQVKADLARDDREWKREIANEAGMLHGVEAYNEVMGYD